ncbi:MAG: TIGR03792 family protein [Acidimicrobiia bacterium]
MSADPRGAAQSGVDPRPVPPSAYRYVRGERLPIEVLVFEMDPAHVDEYLRVDHDVWTLMEAGAPGFDHVPFLSKEVWVDDSRPGRVSIVFVWESMDAWMKVGSSAFQSQLQAEFDRRFPHPVRLVAAPHEDAQMGLYRVSRFERT